MALKLFSSKKEKVGFAIFFISIFLIPILIFAAKQVNDIRQRAYESQSTPPTDQATLAFSYNTPLFGQGIPVGQEFVVKLVVDSPLDITAIESDVNFDPSMLEISSIINITADNYSSIASTSSYFVPQYFEKAQIVKKEYSNTTGNINYTILASPKENYPKNNHSGYFAEVIFKPKKIGQTTINYSPNSAISAKGFGSQNILTKTFPLNLNIIEKSEMTTTEVPITVKFSSLTSNIPLGLTVTAQVNTDVLQLQTLHLKPSGPGLGTGNIIVPLNKNYQILLHKEGFLDAQTKPFITKDSEESQALDATDTPLIPGDIHSNGVIDIFDYNIFVENFGKTSPERCNISSQTGQGDCYPDPDQLLPSDLDFSGKIDIFDYNIFVENFGKKTTLPTPTPTPTTNKVSFTNKWLSLNTTSSIANSNYFMFYTNITFPKNTAGAITGTLSHPQNPCTGAINGQATPTSSTTMTISGSVNGQCQVDPTSPVTVPASATFQGTYWTSIGYLKGTFQASAETSMFGGQTSGDLYIGDIQIQ